MKISIVIPTYNEEENIEMVYGEVTKMFRNDLPAYDYDIIFIDNHSKDKTQNLITELYGKDPEHIKAIFNARNFGQRRSHFYGLTQADGDCAVLLHADLQNPLSAVVEFVRKWEQGAKVVIGVYDGSLENPILTFLRTCYYKVMKTISNVEQIEHFSDFELLDKSFLDVLRKLDDPSPYLRGIVSELGFNMEIVHYVKNDRRHGKSSANFFVLYDFAMNGITSYSSGILRAATVFGFILSLISFLIAVVTFVRKIFYWNEFQIGIAAISTGLFFMMSVVLFFIGLLGEYIININVRIMHRPLVVEEKRLGF